MWEGYHEHYRKGGGDGLEEEEGGRRPIHVDGDWEGVNQKCKKG